MIQNAELKAIITIKKWKVIPRNFGSP